MPSRAIEIHDSELASLVASDGRVVLEFPSAYIHESEGRPAIDAGTGWTQHAVIRIDGEIVAGLLTELPCELSSGYLTLKGEQSNNLIPIPLDYEGKVELRLTSQFTESVHILGN